MKVALWSFVFFAVGVTAQTAPRITSIVTSASFTPTLPVEGALLTITGTNLATSTIAAASTTYPMQLGSTRVEECYFDECGSQPLLFVSPTQINFQVRRTSPPLSAFASYRVVRQGIASDRETVGRWTDAVVEVFVVGYDCPVETPCAFSVTPANGRIVFRAALTDLSYRLVTSTNPARPGQYYTAWVTGLGTYNSRGELPANREVSVLFFNPTTGNFFDHLGSVDADYAGASLQYPGLYQVNFRLPDLVRKGWPGCVAGVQEREFSLRVFLRDSVLVRIPVRTECP